MKQWKIKEKDDAKDFGGQQTVSSGNKWFAPGDVRTADFLIESKQTDKLSYRIETNRWLKLYEEALFAYKIPMLSIQIKDLDLVVLSKEDFLKIHQPLLDKNPKV